MDVSDVFDGMPITIRYVFMGMILFAATVYGPVFVLRVARETLEEVDFWKFGRIAHHENVAYGNAYAGHPVQPKMVMMSSLFSTLMNR